MGFFSTQNHNLSALMASTTIECSGHLSVRGGPLFTPDHTVVSLPAPSRTTTSNDPARPFETETAQPNSSSRASRSFFDLPVYVDHDSDDSIATVNAPLLAVTLFATFLALLARGSFSFVADLTTLPLGRDATAKTGLE